MLPFDAARCGRMRGSAVHAAPAAVLSAGIALAAWLGGPCLDAAASTALTARRKAPAATLENRDATIVLSADGQSVSFIDRASGRNQLAVAGPIARLTVHGKSFPCSAASFDHGRLTLTFGEVKMRAKLPWASSRATSPSR